MKVKALKIFRKRFAIKYNERHGSLIFKTVILIDHKTKEIYRHYTIREVIEHFADIVFGSFAYLQRSKINCKRDKRLKYYKSLKEQ